MTKSTHAPQEPPALAALATLYRDHVKQPTSAELDRGLEALLDRVGAGRDRRGGGVRWTLIGLAAAVSIVLVLGVGAVLRRRASSRELPALSYEVSGGSVLEGGYLRESGHAGMKVLFSEGSVFELEPGTRGRIREVDGQGARMAVEHGTASFLVTPDTGRRWLVEVGPFLVTVKGTVFVVSWDPLAEEFELRLQRGRVVVSGPVSAGEIGLRAGQHLAVNLAKAETRITEESAHEAAQEPLAPPELSGAPANPEALAGDDPSGRKPLTAASPSSVGRATGERRWSEELARGHWDRILADVEHAGLETSLNDASSDDLFALADAARYRRRPELARAALLAERRRFPSGPRALDTLYLLGRVEESREGGASKAIPWYDEYLAKAPVGPFAGEALGRKMTLTDKLEGPARARSIAEEYLRRFPKGSYAGWARALIRLP